VAGRCFAGLRCVTPTLPVSEPTAWLADALDTVRAILPMVVTSARAIMSCGCAQSVQRKPAKVYWLRPHDPVSNPSSRLLPDTSSKKVCVWVGVGVFVFGYLWNLC
jgi:hypothetical protein